MSDQRTCFREVGYSLNDLMTYISEGDIALPDIQRPFVWPNKNVRDLFDSMYRGYPVGYFLFWQNEAATNTRQIGTDGKKQRTARDLIVDGQQRLTSLFAVMRDRAVLDSNFRERKIEIAFRPKDGQFEVTSAAIRRDPNWIPNISVLWAEDQEIHFFINEFLERLGSSEDDQSEERKRIARNISRLHNLLEYPFTALEIAASVDEEQVADVFVRINSKGKQLNQADFILTLLSVHWEEGRVALEDFCRKARSAGSETSPFNHFISPDPDQLLRVAIGYGFGRGRLKSVYQILRGRDPETGQISEARQNEQFAILKRAQTDVLNLSNWHPFFTCLVAGGYRGADMVSSKNTLLFSYILYLLGRRKFNVSHNILQRLIGRWFFATSLTGRYTSSPETVIEADLNRIRGIDERDGNEFLATLETSLQTELTNDFWNIALPDRLATSSPSSPPLFAYDAAQNKLDAPVLFSTLLIRDLKDPAIRANRKPLERHHLFPKGYLERELKLEQKQINQIANYALLQWPDNMEIGDTPPSEYVPELKSRFSSDEWKHMCEMHALPEDWERLSYPEFLNRRQQKMAQIIQRGYAAI